MPAYYSTFKLLIMKILVFCSAVLAYAWAQPQPAADGQSARPGDCLVDGVVRRDGERFRHRCIGVCVCNKGAIGCSSMCPPFIIPPHCRLQKTAGSCCKEGYCPSNQTAKSACQRVQPQSPFMPSFEPQWNVLLLTEVGGRKGSCLGTVVNQSTIFANPECLNERTRITYPEKVSKSKVKISTAPKTGQKFLAADLSPETEFLTTFHEINAPYKEVCDNDECALFVSAFDPENHRMRLLPARHSSSDNCNLNPVDLGSGIVCLELIKDPSGHQQCLNMDGATVAVKNGNAYYLFGFLSDGPFSPKNEKHCDENVSRYRKYHKLCGQYNI